MEKDVTGDICSVVEGGTKRGWAQGADPRIAVYSHIVTDACKQGTLCADGKGHH